MSLLDKHDGAEGERITIKIASEAINDPTNGLCLDATDSRHPTAHEFHVLVRKGMVVFVHYLSEILILLEKIKPQFVAYLENGLSKMV